MEISLEKLSQISKIKALDLCLGCGLCESVCGKDAVEMKLQPDGFFKPVVKVVREDKENIITKICPGLNIINDIPFDEKSSVWGKIEKLYAGYSTDKDIRTKGSSGGIVSGIAIYMLENKMVDSVLQVGGDSNDYERNTLRVSKSKEDVLACASSRYAPALIFDKIFDLLDNTPDTYCFIGKPCDISALKNFLIVYPQYKERFKLTVSIMCAGMPSFKGTKAIINEFHAVEPVDSLVYRGNGWPGYFSFTDSNNNTYRKTYNDSWGKVLNKHLNFRCKLCPDGIGLQADIAVGDAWETKDGYPDFTEKEGQSLIIARTDVGVDLLHEAAQKNDMILEHLGQEKIALMQPYQFARRRNIGARVLAFYAARGKMLNYKHMHVFGNLRLIKLKTFAREFLGTYKRARTR